VVDHGEGIPKEVLDHVFDRFYRGEENSTLNGFGLGLSIAKALVEKQGGTISLISELGKGSQLLLTFPIA
jgi:signal transduction histidine kinase